MIHLPAIPINPVVLAMLGWSVGVLGGFFGVGGGFIVTPALNALGAPIGLAIGTDLAQILGTSVTGTLKHHKLGHVDIKLGIILVIGMVPTIELGKRMVLLLTQLGLADNVIRVFYVCLLTCFGVYMLKSYLSANAQTSPKQGKKLNLFPPPMIGLPKSGISQLSLWKPLVLGLIVGLLSGFTGVGGGFIMVPMLCMMGVPYEIVVGTSLLTVLLGSGIYGTFTYTLANQVDVKAALLMLIGSSLGAQVGARATLRADVKRFRFLFAIILLLVAVSVVIKLVSTAPDLAFFNNYSIYLLLSVAVGMSLFITGFLLTQSGAGRVLSLARMIKRFPSVLWGFARSATLMNTEEISRSREWPYY